MTGLLVAGTTSDAGKSVVTAGICRWLARQGVRVAPFKAQNMSLNSVVTRDGAEIGRAQAMQAAAAGVEPEAAMNPVLLKPGGNGTTQVMVLGEPVAEIGAAGYRDLKPRLFGTVLACLADLAGRFDVVVCEGAGSPAEINLAGRDIANMALARAAALPAVVVADIDRGGVFAALYGTVALLHPRDQALVAGFVLNKFRGDAAVLEPGLGMLGRLTGRPVLGVLPWADGIWLDAEDSLSLGGAHARTPAPPGGDPLRVAVVRLPRISNFTDVDALATEPGVVVRFTAAPAEVTDADLVVLPGSRATVADLAWLREQGLADAVAARAARGRPVLGICGGYQMLGRQIHDDVESGAGLVPGLGLLPAVTRFGAGKVLRRCQDTVAGLPVTGYEIHHGVVHATGGDRFPGGCAAGAVSGTSWHGLLENDGFRRAYLHQAAST
ncbi:MAG TPA: cobyric acid synthase, partial [Streptosporangiaceae bacterium]|nr:cobyric acid synthase [Streptosporangiaceae bacterium]